MSDTTTIIGKATTSQRQACYRFLLVEPDDMRDLIRHLTADGASQVIRAFAEADDRRVVHANEQQVIDDLMLSTD